MKDTSVKLSLVIMVLLPVFSCGQEDSKAPILRRRLSSDASL